MTSWRTELNRVLIILGITGIIGSLMGELLLVWLLTLAVFVVINLYQLRRLNKWLLNTTAENKLDAPQSLGLWGDIFDSIYRIQKQERKASKVLEQIIDKAQESSAALEMAVIMINKQGNLDWWNSASEKLLGLKYPQDRNQSVTNLIRDPRFTEYFHSENYEETLKLEAPGDSRKIIEYQIALFGENERLMIVRDVTQIQRLENMRKDFVGNVSHELGTPITVFKGYLEAIIDNMEEMDPKWEKPMLQMKQQALRMENIVRDLLMLSALETKILPKQQDEIEIAKLISEIENDTKQMFLDKSHQFTVDCDDSAVITGKRSELYSAISNLVVNAAKYTPAAGNIKLLAKLGKDSFDISVEDNGIGIEAQHIPRLTERFYRVDVSRSSDTGGTGLGLAIVKHILLRHDAELEISSEVGKGSLFICKLPLYRISQAENSTSDQSLDSVH
ncbi:MAG: phosphate regulon sensor histidine kinase PhoR [Gammaproteobacteria bacterium]|nr:phosphate regulon sensor histidine kinase PhoR [Gammaproteobacteria bacterium]